MEEHLIEGVEGETSHRPAQRMANVPSRVTGMTLVFVAALLCVKVAGPRAALAPSQATRELAVRELLTATSAKQDAMAVKTAKMSAVQTAAKAALASKHSKIAKSVQKLDEEEPAGASAEEAAPAEEAPAVVAEAPVEPPAAEGGGEANDIGNRFPADELEPGWDKSGWSSGDWASWVITGPLITLAFSFFMFYTYGVPAGALTLIICTIIDFSTFYYNW